MCASRDGTYRPAANPVKRFPATCDNLRRAARPVPAPIPGGGAHASRTHPFPSLDNRTLPDKVERVHDPWAAQNLQVIRTLMERSALYRRALAPVSFAAGVLGTAAGVAGWLAKLDSARAFGILWMLVAIGILAISLLIIRRQAVRAAEPFWSPPSRRVAQAMAPPLLVGFFAGCLVVMPSWRDPLQAWWLPGIWLVLYGCAAHAAGFFMRRGMKLFGWMLGLLGAALLVFVNARSHAAGLPSLSLAHLVMGALFGGSHIAFGLYLSATESRSPAA